MSLSFRRLVRTALVLAVIAPISARAGDDAPQFSPEQVEFFEKQVRPIFAEHCLKCHSADKHKGGLTLNSRTNVLKGGDTGPAIVPGKPAESELVRAVNYGPEGYQMPPDGKLPDELIATLTKWVEIGAPWPESRSASAAGPTEFNLEERAERWSFQPLKRVTPPIVRDARWPRTPVDRFLLARLEAAGLPPAGETDRRTWLRRAYLDTIGLPPTPSDVAEFVADESPQAYPRMVERLLASPHFGERWGRHWLDLVRYAETRGHEFDYDVPNAWHYRDYVIRALNDDAPYDRFVVEHVAGDLLEGRESRVEGQGSRVQRAERPAKDARYALRLDPLTGANESILGTGFWFFGEAIHSPVDIRQEEADRFENMIDVYSKTFLGLTVACARCHDHKFDPIRQKDFYALQGYLQSSSYRQAMFETMEQNQAVAGQLARLRDEAAAALLPVILDIAGANAKSEAGEPATPGGVSEATWTAASGGALDVIADYTDGTCAIPSDAWAFGGRALQPGEIRLSDDLERPVESVVTEAMVELDPTWREVSLSPGSQDEVARLEGWRRAGHTLHTPTFDVRHRAVFVLLDGGCNTYAAVDSHIVINGPLHGSLLKEHPAANGWRWVEHDVSRYIGHRAHLEVIARGSEPLRVKCIVHGDAPPSLSTVRSSEAGVASIGGGPATGAVSGAERLAWIIAHGEQCGLTTPEARARLASVSKPFIERRRVLQSEIRPVSATAPCMLDGSGEDEYVFIRGNWKKPGETVPRRFLEVFHGHGPSTSGTQASSAEGSGRLDLVLQMVDPEQTPIVTRVIVNRIWQHYFGRGIVPTPDDFGYMGQDPSHPELLDWLANELLAHDWSLKHIHRLILLSGAYRMASGVEGEGSRVKGERTVSGVEVPSLDPSPSSLDPNNFLLHRMNIKRLEGEIIRDQILAASGRLDDRLYGKSVPVHLTPFMEGRGRPGISGAVDGEGRRSLYIAVRRNFPDPFFQAFDFPNPHSSVGRRSVSNVPAQALALMNNPFVVEQARVWAERLLRESASATAEERVDRLYEHAFGRAPTDEELVAGVGFIRLQAAEYNGDERDPRVWADFCHVLMNVKEFVFVQ